MKTVAILDKNKVIGMIGISDTDILWEESSTQKEFKSDGSTRKQNAKMGGTYDPSSDEFVDPQPYTSWTLDSNNDWNAPTAKPDDGKVYWWNEDTTSWVEA